MRHLLGCHCHPEVGLASVGSFVFWGKGKRGQIFGEGLTEFLALPWPSVSNSKMCTSDQVSGASVGKMEEALTPGYKQVA